MDIPRRIRVDLFTPAEKAIWDAQQEVEKLPADIRLTEAGTLLGQARNKVSDFVDGVEEKKAMSKMVRGCFGFTTNRGSQVSAIIRWFTGSKWSHAFLIADVVPNATYVMEANEGGTDFRTWASDFGNQAETPTVVYRPVGFTDQQLADAFERARAKYEGVFYGYLELFAIAGMIALAKLGLRVHDPIHQGAICSQVVWFELQDLMPDLFGQLGSNTVSPGDLDSIRQANSQRFEVVTP
jgi:hypothetical protein